MKRDYDTSYPTSSKPTNGKPTNGKPTDSECEEELKQLLYQVFFYDTIISKQDETITEANNQITKLKDIVSSLRERNRALQYQLDNYPTGSPSELQFVKYKKCFEDAVNEKNYFIHRLKKEVEKTTELAQAVTNLKRRNKSLLGNFKSIKNANHDDLTLAVGLYAELVKQVSIIMDRNKPDTTQEYRKTLDEVVRTINQQASMINEIHTVIQNSKNRKD